MSAGNKQTIMTTIMEMQSGLPKLLKRLIAFKRNLTIFLVIFFSKVVDSSSPASECCKSKMLLTSPQWCNGAKKKTNKKRGHHRE